MKTIVKKILVGLAVIIFLVWAFFFFAFDPLLKKGIIVAIQSCTGAKAEIASLKTKFLHPMLEIKGLSAASSHDEFKNSVEFAQLKFEVEGMPLFKKKFIADEASLTGLKFGTPRKTSGKMPAGTNKLKKLNKAASEYVEKMKAEANSYTLQRKEELKTDFTINPEELETVKLAKSLEEEYKKTYASITSGVTEEKYKKQIEDIKEAYKAAKAESNVIKQALAYKEAAKKAKELKENFDADKKAVRESLANAKNAIKKLDQAKKGDLAMITGKMQLPSLDAESIAKMLAGPEMADKVEFAFSLVETAKKYMSAKGSENTPEKEEEQPKESDNSGLPNFVIKKMALSGEFGQKNPLSFDGNITNFTTEPGIWGRPAIAKISGAKGQQSLDFNVKLRAAAGKILTDSKLSFNGADISSFKLGSENSFMLAVADSVGNITAELKTNGTALDGNAGINLTGTSFIPSSEQLTGTTKSIVETTFRNMKSAKIGVKIGGDYPMPSLSLTTDIASQLSNGLKKAAGDEVNKATAKARAKLEEAIKPYTEKLVGISAENEKLINGKLDIIQALINKETGNLIK